MENKYMRSPLSQVRGIGNKGASKQMVSVIIGIVILAVLVTALAPTIFNGSDSITGAPTWFNTVYPLILAAGLITLVWRMFN